VAVVTTYHGCDINRLTLRVFSIFSILLSSYNIFVSSKQVKKVKVFLKGYQVIPCGVDTNIFYPIAKLEARKKLGIDINKKIVLFSSTFTREEKNSLLAINAIKMLSNVELIELDGYSREEVCLLMNACDAGLLTSIREGSPMFIKELMACNRPIVSTNVGDVEENILGVEGCFLVPFDAKAVSDAVERAMQYDTIVFSKESNAKFDNQTIAKKIVKVYNSIIS
jgi:glycosyltransferase involved in cell wall biosynthesis